MKTTTPNRTVPCIDCADGVIVSRSETGETVKRICRECGGWGWVLDPVLADAVKAGFFS